MRETPRSIVEEELNAAGVAWSVREGKSYVFSFAGLTYVAARSCGGHRTLENTRAGIKRMIRQLTGGSCVPNLIPAPSRSRNGEHA